MHSATILPIWSRCFYLAKDSESSTFFGDPGEIAVIGGNRVPVAHDDVPAALVEVGALRIKQFAMQAFSWCVLFVGAGYVSTEEAVQVKVKGESWCPVLVIFLQ